MQINSAMRARYENTKISNPSTIFLQPLLISRAVGVAEYDPPSSGNAEASYLITRISNEITTTAVRFWNTSQRLR